MEEVLKDRELSYSKLFKGIGAGNMRHAPLELYSRLAIQTECSRQNKYAQCTVMRKKFRTSTAVKKGYITILQMY